MKTPSIGTLSFGLVGLFAIFLLAVGTPNIRTAPSPATPPTATPPSVSARGFSLASTSANLPTDDGQFPAGLHASIVNTNCTSCHSASMALTQPTLSADQWRATITKMREIYHAPVREEDTDRIVAYLMAMPGQKAVPATGRAQDPDPKAGTDISGGAG